MSDSNQRFTSRRSAMSKLASVGLAGVSLTTVQIVQADSELDPCTTNEIYCGGDGNSEVKDDSGTDPENPNVFFYEAEHGAELEYIGTGSTADGRYSHMYRYTKLARFINHKGDMSEAVGAPYLTTHGVDISTSGSLFAPVEGESDDLDLGAYPAGGDPVSDTLEMEERVAGLLGLMPVVSEGLSASQLVGNMTEDSGGSSYTYFWDHSWYDIGASSLSECHIQFQDICEPGTDSQVSIDSYIDMKYNFDLDDNIEVSSEALTPTISVADMSKEEMERWGVKKLSNPKTLNKEGNKTRIEYVLTNTLGK